MRIDLWKEVFDELRLRRTIFLFFCLVVLMFPSIICVTEEKNWTVVFCVCSSLLGTFLVLSLSYTTTWRLSLAVLDVSVSRFKKNCCLSLLKWNISLFFQCTQHRFNLPKVSPTSCLLHKEYIRQYGLWCKHSGKLAENRHRQYSILDVYWWHRIPPCFIYGRITCLRQSFTCLAVLW